LTSRERSGPEATPGAGTAERQQVAAVCYRAGARGLEFLLVQTRGGRWIFPKGGVEPGLTQAQSAALEAFEEAGVHGRIEEMPFARYQAVKSGKNGRREANGPASVTAHLCEVSHLESPQEADRQPTWFPPEKAKRRLREDRTAETGEELCRIVDRAVARIQRLRMRMADITAPPPRDALQQVRFEAFDTRQWRDAAQQAALLRHFLRGGGEARFALRAFTARRALARPPLRLVAGSRPDAKKMSGR
jgi:8-oxo-dGTP pyrophosphatase MutT (NUDIX family)